MYPYMPCCLNCTYDVLHLTVLGTPPLILIKSSFATPNATSKALNDARYLQI